ncbi:MAG TPA: ammonium transporter [Dehalococcoidia bacterium]|nr:ammonium transporter [Dehalococcoidia bacterium]
MQRRILMLPVVAVVAVALALAIGSATASAQEPTAEMIADLATAIDTAWLLIAAILVLFMQLGFAYVEAGFIRSKNVVNILMKNVLDLSVGAIAYWAVGFGLAYGASEAANGFVGSGNFFLADFTDYPTWLFQFAFAATAATIVSGAMAERTRFHAYLVYTVVITAVVYPVVTHWIWDGNGWLTAFTDDPIGANGMVDFAGSTVVHSVGGWAALVGAIVVGPRLGKYGPNGEINPMPGHSMTVAMLGVMVLWIGWYGFNPGSTLGLTGGLAAVAARVAVTTTLAAGAGALSAMAIGWARTGKSDLSLTLNGVLGGLVAITAPTATVDPWAAVVIGLVAGAIIVGGVELLDRLQIDDPVGAVPVHLMNGIWGTLAVGLFTSQAFMADAFGVETESYGLLLGGGFDMLKIQALGIAAVGAWTVGISIVLFVGIRATIGLRVSPAEEESGLDVGEHGMEAYPEFTGARDPFGLHTGAALTGLTSADSAPEE